MVRELAERLAIAHLAPGQPREVFADQGCLALSASARGHASLVFCSHDLDGVGIGELLTVLR